MVLFSTPFLFFEKGVTQQTELPEKKSRLTPFYRMGYYGGSGGRHMAKIGPFQGSPQQMPMMTMERLRECKWEVANTFTIPNDWPSGIYLGKLSLDETFGKQSYIIFVVKEHRK